MKRITKEEILTLINKAAVSKRKLAENLNIPLITLFKIVKYGVSGMQNKTVLEILKKLGSPRWQEYTEVYIRNYKENIYDKMKKKNITLKILSNEIGLSERQLNRIVKDKNYLKTKLSTLDEINKVISSIDIGIFK